MERPDRLFSQPDAYFEAGRPWRFGETPFEAVEQLFRDSGLTAKDLAWLLDRANWQVNAGVVQITPPSDLLFHLSPGARGRIYSFLAQIPGNLFKNDPFKISTNYAAQWFQDSGVSKETEQLIRSLTYRRGPMVCFSDPGLLADRIPVGERRPVLKALSRMPAQRAFLHIEPGDDLRAVTNYWSAGGRVSEMLPLLDSLRQSNTGGRIDLAYLLPRFCSERLFTFPDPATQPDADLVDCFWTALNFFRYPPEQRFLDVPSRLRHVQTQYHVHPDEPRFGDMLALYDARQEPLHACVYVAGDIVFTKNGATVFSPWVLMSYRDMLDYYSMDGTPTMRVLRVKQPLPG